MPAAELLIARQILRVAQDDNGEGPAMPKAEACQSPGMPKAQACRSPGHPEGHAKPKIFVILSAAKDLSCKAAAATPAAPAAGRSSPARSFGLRPQDDTGEGRRRGGVLSSRRPCRAESPGMPKPKHAKALVILSVAKDLSCGAPQPASPSRIPVILSAAKDLSCKATPPAVWPPRQPSSPRPHRSAMQQGANRPQDPSACGLRTTTKPDAARKVLSS